MLNFSGNPDFGSCAVNATVNGTFTITNIGDNAATKMTGTFYLSSSFAYLGGTYPGMGGTCTNTLPPKKSCTVVVSFTPRILRGNRIDP